MGILDDPQHASLQDIDPNLVDLSLPQGATLPDSLAPGSAPYMPMWGTTSQDWGKVAGALSDLSKGIADGNKKDQQQAQAPAVVGQSQSAGVGRPTTQVSMDALVRMLAERRNQYFTSAMSGHAQPVQQSNTRGLLGF